LFDSTFSDYQLSFDAAWELDFWGRFRRAVQSGIGNFEVSIADYDNTLVTLTAEVARTYVVIRTLEERLSIARENVKIQERSLQIAEVRFRGGDVSELDVSQATALLRETQALIPRIQADLRQSKNGYPRCLPKWRSVFLLSCSVGVRIYEGASAGWRPKAHASALPRRICTPILRCSVPSVLPQKAPGIYLIQIAFKASVVLL
jgi:hypothetical protein